MAVVEDKIFENYPKTKCPINFFKDSHTVTEADVREVFELIKKESSPGFPYARIAKSKGLLIEEHATVLVRLVLARLDALQNSGLNLYGDSAHSESLEEPVYLVQRGLVDPVRLFVKKEPHDALKTTQGRLRLISSVSSVDEIIERLLCSTQNNAEIDEWVTCPSKPGIGLSLDEQARRLYDSVQSHLGGAKETDISGWDWSVKWWMLEFDVSCRIRLARAPHNSAFAKILYARMFCLARSLYVTSDGNLFSQKVPGVMKSGSYNTSATNSRMRVAVAYLAGADWAIAMGDDAVEQDVWGSDAVYESLGLQVKLSRRCELNSFEFCSNRFTDGLAVPLNWDKGLYRLLSAKPELERALQFIQEYRHSPMLEVCKEAISRLWKLPRKFLE